LELDLIGYGKTESDSVEDLKQAVEAQISFAHQMRDSSLIGFPAEKEFFDRWDESQRQILQGQILGDKSLKLKAKAIVISITKDEIKALQSRSFKKANDLVCA
jgi:hypothetical protein